MLKVTVTGLTASFLTIIPVVWRALVTVVSSDILPAVTGSSFFVTVTLTISAGRLDSPGRHTGTNWNGKKIIFASLG